MTVAMTSSLLDTKNRYADLVDEMSTRVDMLQGRLDEVREQLLAERRRENRRQETARAGEGEEREEGMEVDQEKEKKKRKKKKKKKSNTAVEVGVVPAIVAKANTSGPPSFASVVAGGKGKAAVEFTVVKRKERKDQKEKEEKRMKERRPAMAFIVEKGQGSSEEARNRLWSRIVKKVVAPKVSAIRVLPRGDILVKPADEATTRALAEIEGEERSGVRKEVTRNPKVLVYNVERTLKAEEVSEALARQNPGLGCTVEEMRAAVKPLFMKGPRDDPLVRWICEIDPVLYGKMIKKRFFIGMSLCSVVDFTEVLQCFRCQGFGHEEAKCKKEKALCSHCGMEGHKQSECKAKDKAPECVNCGLSFTAGHASCPVRRKFERGTLLRTDYGSSPK